MRVARLAAAAVTVLLVFPASALACACCADPGYRSERRAPLSGFERKEVARVRLAGAARTFVSPRGLEGVRGIESVSTRYAVSEAVAGLRRTLRFRDGRGHEGRLTFHTGAAAVQFAVDLRDGKQLPGGGPLLLKELRLEGRVTGTGIFRAGLVGAPRFRLILQGRGGACFGAADFRNWTLEVRGPRASFSLFGALRAPAPA